MNQRIKAFIVHDYYVAGGELGDFAADVEGYDNAKAAQQGLRDEEGFTKIVNLVRAPLSGCRHTLCRPTLPVEDRS